MATSFKKIKRPRGTARKRPAEEDAPSANSTEPSVIKAARKQESNPLIQASAGFKSKRARLEAYSDDDLEDTEKNAYTVSYSSKRNVNAAEQAEARIERGESPPEIKTGEEAALLTESAMTANDGLYHGTKNYKSKLPAGSSKYGATGEPN